MRILTDMPRYSFMQVAFTLRDGKFICTDTAGIHHCSAVIGEISPPLRAYYMAGSCEYMQYTHTAAWCTRVTTD